MKTSLFVRCILLAAVVSCSQDPESPQTVLNNDFKTIRAAAPSDTLTPVNSHHLSDSLLLVNPFRMVNVDDAYLVISQHRSSDFFAVFDLISFRFLYSFGTLSQGPEANEFVSVPLFLNTEGDHLITYEAISRTLTTLKINDTFVEKVKDQRLSYEGQIDPLNRVRRIDDNLYVADYGSSIEDTENEFIALEPDNQAPLFTFGNYPESETEGFERYGHFLKENVSSPNGERFAAFYFYQNRFKIFNREGKELAARMIDDPFMQLEAARFEDRFLYRTMAWASNDYIYTLGLNNRSAELYANPDFSHRTLLEVWNWQGEPVYRARFDRLITNFTVSELHGKLYALSGDVGETIFEYDLPDF